MELVLEDDAKLCQQRERLSALLEEERKLQQEIDLLGEKKRELFIERQSLESSIQSALKEERQRMEKEELDRKQDNETGDTSNGSTEDEEEEDSEKCVNSNGTFLNEDDPRRNDRVALASYPRSGNSLLRSMVEEITGITTGSDSDPKRSLVKHLIAMGMKGEGIVDGRVWCVKTHYPERLGYCKMAAKRAIVVIRNPFDAIVSYFNMVLTQTHTHSLQDEEFEKYAEIWDSFLREEVVVWKRFHAHWNAVAEAKPLILRYEDLVQHRQESLLKLADFLYGKNSSVHLTPEEIKERIDSLVGKPLEELGVYQPRSPHHHQVGGNGESRDSNVDGIKQDEERTVTKRKKGSGLAIPQWPSLTKGQQGFLGGLRFFSDEQKKFVLYTAKEELSAFGYWEPFEEDFGPAHIPPKLQKCIVVTKAKSEMELQLNTRYPIRPVTDDDPFARGFGRRWKLAVSKLPPPRVYLKSRNKR